MSDTCRKCVLIGCTGSVAAIKLPQLTKSLLEDADGHIDITVVLTERALHFCGLDDLPGNVRVYRDEDEWTWRDRGDPVLHIDLAKWADVFVIAPLDANTLAKLAQGLCDNLLTCVARAWNLRKPLVFCPAMNTRMWEHPITATHVSILKSWGYHEVPCVAKTLVCGDTGLGAMAAVPDITRCVREKLKSIGSCGHKQL